MPFLVPTEIGVGQTPPAYPAVITDGVTTLTGTGGAGVAMSSPTLLGDASDTSYFEHWRSSIDVAPSGSVFITLNPTPGYVFADLPLSVRAEMADAGTTSAWSTRFVFDVYDNNNGNYLGWFSHVYGFGIELPGSGIPYTIDNIDFVPDSAHGKTLADLNYSLQHNGLNLNLAAFAQSLETGVIRMLRVYELTFGARRLSPLPLRRYPPVNNGGFGPTRHVPNSGARHAGWSY